MAVHAARVQVFRGDSMAYFVKEMSTVCFRYRGTW
jgi:hypothetical protein